MRSSWRAAARARSAIGSVALPEAELVALASELATVEDGRRYRLTLTISPDAPTGKEIVPVVIGTDSPVAPAVRIAVATYVRARVYTFPDALDLGALPLSDWTRSGASLAQTLMVYQPGGTAFAASFSSDVPGLRIQAVRGPGGDRWQATVTLDPAHVRVGAIRGAVTIATNDPEFPRLNVPLAGAILPDNAPSPP